MPAEHSMQTMTAAAPPSQDVPLRLVTAAEFARVRSLLHAAQFEEEMVCRALHIASMADLGAARREHLDTAASSATFALLVRLFVLVEAVPVTEVEGAVDAPMLDSLVALDLLRLTRRADGNEVYFAPVLLYPIAGLLIASDRYENPDGSPFVPPPDVVFPAIFRGTLRFLRVISKSPADEALDLCCGTGIGALVLSRHVRRAVASDITGRATQFARFNRLLNGCENVEVVQGDLYEPVEGRMFDRVIAHPPYVPALSETHVFRDAGETGEGVLERIVAGLPRHLRPGGTFYCLSAGWDTAEGPFETRIRGWLGDHSPEFDLILAQQEEMSPSQVVRWLSDKSAGGDGVREAFEKRFTAAALERNVYGAIVLHRVGSGAHKSEPVTERVRMSGLTDGSSLDASQQWHRWRSAKEAEGTLANALLAVNARLGSGLRVKVTHTPHDGALALTDVVLESDRPFHAATRIDPWMLPLVGAFKAGRCAREVYDDARRAGTIPEAFGPADFAMLVAIAVERGYLEVEGSLR